MLTSYFADFYDFIVPSVWRSEHLAQHATLLFSLAALAIAWFAVVRGRGFNQVGAKAAALVLLCISGTVGALATLTIAQNPGWSICDAPATIASTILLWTTLFHLTFCTFGGVLSRLVGQAWVKNLDRIYLSIAMVGILWIGLHGDKSVPDRLVPWSVITLGIAVGLWMASTSAQKFGWCERLDGDELSCLMDLKRIMQCSYKALRRRQISSGLTDTTVAIALIYVLLAASVAATVENITPTSTCQAFQLSYPNWLPAIVPLAAIVFAPTLALRYIRSNRSAIEFVFLIFGLYAFIILAFAIGIAPLGIKSSGQKGDTAVTDILDYLYYSAITFTTLGYGDLAPCDGAKIFAAAEAVFGAFLLPFSSAGLFLAKFLDVEKPDSHHFEDNSTPRN